MEYADFFRMATDQTPFDYQRCLATRDIFPHLLTVPTGSGKTAAVILGWLWRRRFGGPLAASTPRRLVYCLPMRVLVEQTAREAAKWLDKLGIKDVGVHILIGGERAERWELTPEKEAILIGTQDMLLSRALNRGYGMSRYAWPLHFGLLNNDCLWVMDEPQLMGSGLATTTQLAGFRKAFGAGGTTQSLWMSATLMPGWLESIDFKQYVAGLKLVKLEEEDFDNKHMKERYGACKPIEPAGSSNDRSPALVERIRKAHAPGTLTLVVVNTVDRAREIFEGLRTAQKAGTGKGRKKGRPANDAGESPEVSPEFLLIHSRFRPKERAKQIDRLQTTPPASGRIVISTQVVEAGVDVSALTLFTELAPWPSLVQRFGRCNRRGEDTGAKVFWIDLPTGGKKSLAAPYSDEELDAAREILADGSLNDVGPSSLEVYFNKRSDDQKAKLFPYRPEHVVRRKDVIELFDTTPDLAGNDVDVARFIRDGEDLDVQVFWRHLDGSTVPSGEADPRREELCTVPVHRFREFLKEKIAFRFDPLEPGWKRATADSVFPGRVFLIPADRGGYDPTVGWAPKSSEAVEPLSTGDAPPESYDSEPWSKFHWQTIAEHTDEVVAELEAILKGLGLDERLCADLRLAARWHDRGKAHDVFQAAIKDVEGRPSTRDLAKAPRGAWTRGYSRPHFRHELASALAMLQAGSSDLAAYLGVATHGKVRLSIRSLPGEDQPNDSSLRFARGVWDGDVLKKVDVGGGLEAAEVTLSLDVMEMGRAGDEPSWSERVLALRDDPDLGIFRLAFLEAILRAADMRASRAHERSGEGQSHA